MPESMIEFVPATREAVYSRVCVHGPGGAGKTYTGLLAMHSLCKGEPFAVIDTERGRSRKYYGVNGWYFDIWEPHTFSPASLTEALGIAAGKGYPGVVIDSGSLFWNGAEGMTEQVDKFASASGRNDKFGGWKEMAPIERRMWDAVLTYPGHIWMTLRVTSHYVVEERQRGERTVATPRKVGLKPVQREGFDYEFDLVAAMDQDNGFLVTKSDILTIPQSTFIEKPGVEFAEAIAQFCAEGVETTGVMAYRSLGLAPEATVESLKALHGDVSRAGLVNAPVTDEFGNPTVLGDLLRQRAVALTTAAQVAAKAAAPKPAPAPAPAPAPTKQEVVAGFRNRILASTTADQVRDMIAEMRQAGLEGTEDSTDTQGAATTIGKLATQVGKRLAATRQEPASTSAAPVAAAAPPQFEPLTVPEANRDLPVTVEQLGAVDKLFAMVPADMADVKSRERRLFLTRELIGRAILRTNEMTQGEARDLSVDIISIVKKGDLAGFVEYFEQPRYQPRAAPGSVVAEQSGAAA